MSYARQHYNLAVTGKATQNCDAHSKAPTKPMRKGGATRAPAPPKGKSSTR